MTSTYIKEFRAKLEKQPRERLLEIIEDQNPEFIPQINRIEYVFSKKMNHLQWNDGTPVIDRPLTQQELALLIDPPFKPDPDLSKMGVTLDKQKEVHIASDVVLWARDYLNTKPRVYQILLMRDPSLRKVFRLGRRSGKSYSMAIILLHHAHNNRNGRCLVMAPMKSQVALIYEECLKLAKQGKAHEAITRSIQSPQHELHLSTGSTIRFFTTGMRSGGKSDVARGQEAHLIILDEMDYMGIDDLDALYAMLQKTDENQADKIMIGASTPSGRRERFYQWAHGLSPDGTKLPKGLRFKEFWFPALVNPLWDKQIEIEMRNQYSENAYRHEIEADWGEDSEGVYPRKYVDLAFIEPSWKYIDARQSARSDFVIGVDWDKFGAGPNLVVLEICPDSYEEERFANKLRIAYRQEIPRGDYVLSEAVERVIQLNQIFQPKHIYIDRGYGEVQYELLMKHGVENPQTKLRDRVKGIAFGGNIEIRDPSTKQKIKKDTKPYMVDNLRTLLETQKILFPESDEELYLQLVSYVVVRMSAFGKPVFGSSGSQVDHAHDALALACLAYTDNYGDFNKLNIARFARSISHNLLLPTQADPDSDVRSPGDPFEPKDYKDESDTPKPRTRRRNLAARSVTYSRSISRKNI